MGFIEKTVFISYRRTNVPWALAIYQNLTYHGYDVFFDYFNIPSGSFEKTILENIKRRAHFLIILTPSALERCNEPGDWLRREIETAMDERRNIVPLMLEGFDFGNPLVRQALTGKLASLPACNGLRVYAEYFLEGMNKLRKQFLNVDVSEVPLPELTVAVREITAAQISKANAEPPVVKEQLTAQEWFERGYVFQTEANNPEEAIRCYREAILLDPSLGAAYNNLAGVLHDLKRYEEAEAACRKAIELDPAHATAYNNLGVLSGDLKRYEEAEAAYRKVIELDPSDAHAYNGLGMVFRLKDRLEDALAIYKQLMEIEPGNFNTYMAVISIQKHMGREISKKLIEQVRQLMPEDDWYSRACLESVCNNFDLAFEYLRQTAEHERLNPEWAWIDPDLQWIRNDPRFEEIVGPPPK